MADRPAQTACTTCNHSKSFHPGYGRCVAFGCQCTRWRVGEVKAQKAKAKRAKAERS